MKTIITILIGSIIHFSLAAQVTDVFLLVDVSGSMNETQLNNEARNIAKEIIMAEYDKADYQNWRKPVVNSNQLKDILNNSSQQQPLLSNGSYFYIIPFGNKNRYKNYSMMKVRNYPGDFENFYENNYPTAFRDQLTFMTLARAFAGSLAKTNNIKDYFIIEITDNLDDNTGSIDYNKYENNLLNSWDVKGVNKAQKVAILEKELHGKRIKINFWRCEYVAIFPSATAQIQIKNPSSSQNSPHKMQVNQSLNLKWSCRNYNGGFDVKILKPKSEKATYRTKDTSYTIKPDTTGLYEIMIKNTNSQDFAYIEVTSKQTTPSGESDLRIVGKLGRSNKNDPLKAKKGEFFSINWVGNAGKSPTEVTLYNEKTGQRHSKTSENNSVSFKLKETGLHEVSISNSEGRDIAYLKVSGEFPWKAILLALIIIGGAVIVLNNIDRLNISKASKGRKEEFEEEEDMNFEEEKDDLSI